ncbi:MAG: TerB family tellurite resistance protein [Armatimonadetes bacterium]|nr:TerB family tellurite resistance protein [Armatimonadota bacterium]
MDERQKEILKSLVHMAQADGKVSDSERKLLDRMAELLGCNQEELARLGTESPHLDEVMIDHQDGVDAVRALLVMSFSDGFLTFEEFDYLESVVQRLGITPEELEELRKEALELSKEGL